MATRAVYLNSIISTVRRHGIRVEPNLSIGTNPQIPLPRTHGPLFGQVRNPFRLAGMSLRKGRATALALRSIIGAAHAVGQRPLRLVARTLLIRDHWTCAEPS